MVQHSDARGPASYSSSNPSPGCGITMMVVGAIFGILALLTVFGSWVLAIVFLVLSALGIGLGYLSYVTTTRQLAKKK